MWPHAVSFPEIRRKKQGENVKIDIKNRYNGYVLFSCECENIKTAVVKAVKAKVDLSYADLRYADLSSANLRYADLRYADLRYAKGEFIFNFGVKLEVKA